MKKWLFNPFVYVAGGKALGLGMLAIFVTAVVQYFTSTHFDGLLHMSTGTAMPFWIFLGEQTICWLSLSLVLFAGALIFSASKTRFIDVIGTQALARWPAIAVAALGAGIHIPKTMDPAVMSSQISFVTVVCALLSLTFMIWMVALSYNAFRVSANIKGGKGVAIFITGLLLADILSRVIFAYT